MKKVININFQGRVIPIEEAAYDILKGYTDSLRKYFAKEEGRDEIINDIENRIAELFSEDLKRNPTGCITEADVQKVIGSMGRPEDFDGGEVTSSASDGAGAESYSAAQDQQGASFYRDMNDKILGGVCSGLAHRLNIDPTIVRVIFAIVTLGGFGTGFLLYILLWIILPKKGFDGIPARRRLYRNPDQKMVGGVASGLASYFNIAVWIPRLIFALPLVAGILNSMFRTAWWWDGNNDLPDFVFNGFGGTLFLTYIILWIVIPQAKTASEKLEMRGEKIDLKSIKNSVQDELKDVKVRAEKFGQDFGDKAKAWGGEVEQWGKEVSNEASPAARRLSSGIGHAIGVIFKAFFLFIAGIIIFALFMTLMGVLFSGGMVYGLKDYVLGGFWQNLMAFNTLALLLGIPVIAAVVWLIRRISGVRSTNNYLGWIFGSLWTIGLISFIILVSQLAREFRRTGSTKEEAALASPSKGRMIVDVKPVEGKFYNLEWFDDSEMDRSDFPVFTATEDSMLLNTVRIKLVPSNDSAYHAYLVKFARSSDPVKAEANAEKISFPIEQRDSLLLLPSGFVISKQTKFRNQQVLVVIEVPVGKQIRIDHSTDRYKWFNVSSTYRGRNKGLLVIDWDEDWDRDYNYKTDVWYTMTASGLQRTDGKSDWRSDDEKGDAEGDKDGYRYRRGKDIRIDSVEIDLKDDTTVNIKLNTERMAPEGARKENETLAADSRKHVRNYAPLISIFNLMKLVR